MLLGMLLVVAPTVRRSQANGGTVDLALVLAVDTSRSVNDEEYQLQRGGLAYAIQHPEVISAIQSGPLKKIAVTVVQWTDFKAQVVIVPWTFINDARSAMSFSRRTEQMARFFGGHGTHISGVISFGTWLLGDTPFVANRKVIDVSGDGRDNVTSMPGQSRDAAVAAGITVNGLAIENEEKDLRQYYRKYVIGGPGAFVMQAQRYEDFGTAMKKKLVREIAPKFLTLKPIPFDAG